MTTKDKKSPEKLLSEARDDFLDKISVAGWREAFGEKVMWIRRCFLASLLVLSGFSLFYSYQGIAQWLRSGYKDEITDMADLDSLPFTNVTICAQVNFNETYIRSVVTVPEDMQQRIKKEAGLTMDAFYSQLTFYLSVILRPRFFNQAFLNIVRNLTAITPSIQDLATLIEEALPSCEAMIRRCWFNGRAFDCCGRAVKTVDDDGVCFLITVETVSSILKPRNV